MEGRWPSRYVTGTPEWVVDDALIGACFAECRAVGAAEHEAAGRERDTYYAALDTLVAERDRLREACENTARTYPYEGRFCKTALTPEGAVT